MASSHLKGRVILGFVSILSLFAVYWFMFTGKRSDEYSPEEINDMFQNKKSEVSVKRIELPDHGISSPYLDKQTLKSPNWDIQGDFIISNGNHISLTSDGKHQAANMFSKKPLNAESFEMELTFHLHGKSVLKADGFAVWFLDKPSPVGDVFGSTNNFKGLGIIVDTFRNGKTGEFPLISAQYSSSSLFFDKHTDGVSTSLWTCTDKQILDPASEKSRMRIVHTKNGYLSVDFNHDPDHSADWHNCFTVTGVHLPQNAYLGISAETGELYENVDIIENKIFALYSPDGDHYIESLEELEKIMEKQVPEEAPQNSPQKKTPRKSIMRLRKAEERIKEKARARRLEKYGDADATFVRRWAGRFLMAAKILIVLLLLVFVAWVVRVALKSRKGNRGYRSTGLLDG